MVSWRRFRRLIAAERELLLQAMLLLPLTAVALRLLGYRRWHAVLVRLAPQPAASAEAGAAASLERALLTARMVRAAERRGQGRPNCLRHSLVLWWLLRRQGISSELRIGVRKENHRFEAHAWVEHAGAVLSDGEDVRQHYAPFEHSVAAAQAEPR